ncbi:hypothetical protein K458DRAFT_310422 [Lentithecium fluviatile CBS 122367]|uniref:Heterokaryon incompatibility domain-containing protein n=1 Tax=Lentithecium fluviatile CBS 122367 TaxID=1168545 RepID=A0A6G1IS58_9PLEO|nr:hypothetical protein K458DRAFT_310422 [Lentithecium fluviatile CBS 122367]
MRSRTILSHAKVPQNLPFLLGNYQYTPLPSPTSIRLLELVPSEDQRVVQCSLRAFELEDAPLFFALSYTWGNPLMRLKSTIAFPKNSHTLNTVPNLSASDPDNGIFSQIYGEPESSKSSRRHSVFCDGRIIKVTSNLKDALRMLASSITSQSPSPTYYWIDALCMDQQNILERNAQVAKMAEIFKKAQNVIVWLGKEDEYTMDALTTIEKVSAVPEEAWSSVPYTSFYDPIQSSTYQRPDLSYHNWLGFIALINRPWFKRAWAMQEIALAKSATVVCGDKTFPWEKLSRTLSFIKASKWYHHLQTEKLRHVKSLQKNAGQYKRILQSKLDVGVGPVYLNATRLKLSKIDSTDPNEQNQKPPLRMLIDTHRFSKSTDPRDKVYAFLGLADRNMAPFRSQPNSLVPNYNLSVQEVYLETARVLMTSYRNLSLLSHVEDPSQTRIPNLPSWVPDYSVKLDPYPLRYRGPSYWKASGNLKWEPNIFSMANGELELTGYHLDTIDQTSILQNESDDPSASWASIVKLALSLDLPYPNPGNHNKSPGRVEVLWRTLTTDIYNKIYPAPPKAGSLFIDYILNLQIRHRLTPWSSSDEFQPHHSPLSESIYPEWRTLLQLEPMESFYSLGKYRERLATVVESMFNGTYSPIGLAQLQHEFDQSGGKRRRLFKTKEGYLGTGARSLREGDEVWILHTAGVPFVLRPQPNGHHRLIGESFVYGVMHGEMQGLSLPRRQITLE